MKAVVHTQGGDSHLRSIVKAVSWRCVGTLDTFVVSFLVLSLSGAAESSMAAMKVSGGIAGVEVITKVALYYLHERTWARISFGRPRPPTTDQSAAENVP
jgi:uncharacterized membrane protein